MLERGWWNLVDTLIHSLDLVWVALLRSRTRACLIKTCGSSCCALGTEPFGGCPGYGSAPVWDPLQWSLMASLEFNHPWHDYLVGVTVIKNWQENALWKEGEILASVKKCSFVLTSQDSNRQIYEKSCPWGKCLNNFKKKEKILIFGWSDESANQPHKKCWGWE